mmetsp:Transcript_66347/g.104933  ORF Transcript_66347/g.104933 Transcript_66347/m.104933 type:complete len:95 (-) Transcript_66347:127-411(-)
MMRCYGRRRRWPGILMPQRGGLNFAIVPLCIEETTIRQVPLQALGMERFMDSKAFLQSTTPMWNTEGVVMRVDARSISSAKQAAERCFLNSFVR